MNVRADLDMCPPSSWDVTKLADFYTKNRQLFINYANRILKNRGRSEEIVQDSLIKFMLASPELRDENQAIAYVKRSVENLCIDVLRMEKRRPNIVALDEISAELDRNLQTSGDFETQLSAADDAAIIRQALSLLSHAERAALVMWEIDGRSTEEIAKELGIKPSAVRKTVSRARATFRKVLTSVVVDEKRGLTAMDLLSTSYRNISIVAEKSGKLALSLVLVASAFLGFNSLTGSEKVSLTSVPGKISSTESAIEDLSSQNVRSDLSSENSPSKELIGGGFDSSAFPAEDLDSIDSLTADLEFKTVQLESVALMLTVISSLEEK